MGRIVGVIHESGNCPLQGCTLFVGAGNARPVRCCDAVPSLRKAGGHCPPLQKGTVGGAMPGGGGKPPPYGAQLPTQAAGIPAKGLKVMIPSAAAAREGQRVVLREPPVNNGRNQRVFIRGIT